MKKVIGKVAINKSPFPAYKIPLKEDTANAFFEKDKCVLTGSA